jgi:capsular exopolysaccharide synthesis family protein
MSRIHDALKRAAEERSSELPVEKGRVVSAIDPETLDSRVSLHPVAEPAERIPRIPQGGQLLGFEDLVKQCTHTQWKPDPALDLFRCGDTGGVGAERFRTLRSRLYQMAGTRALKRILITSSLPGEGKTFVTANLAKSIVRQPERRVLLIDADLREPRLNVAFGAPNKPGLSEYLAGNADDWSVIQTGSQSNLYLIASGERVSNPSELLLTAKMKKLLDCVSPLFDWVILDSPPALPVHDASRLADLCDGVLFVVGAGETSYEQAEKACLEFRKKNLLGVVLNRTETGVGYAGYSYEHVAEPELEKP